MKLFAGDTDGFVAWIGERTNSLVHAYDLEIRDADLETVTTFYAGQGAAHLPFDAPDQSAGAARKEPKRCSLFWVKTGATVKVAAEKPIHTVSVRDLVEFVLRRGDLGGEREFVGSDRALAGIRGHQKIQRSRPTGYLTELPVEHRVEVDEFTLLIRGRIDGLLITSERVLLEEIKTVSASWNHEADPLHWAQAKFYGFMHARENALKELVIQLVYLELPGGKVTEFRRDLFLRRTV